jgi:hypothetical protein
MVEHLNVYHVRMDSLIQASNPIAKDAHLDWYQTQRKLSAFFAQ